MSYLPAEEAEEERFTPDLVRLQTQCREHFIYLTAKTNTLDAHFFDTGSCRSIISRNFVASKESKLCKTEGLPFATDTLNIIGRASVSLILSNGCSLLEVAHKVYVAEELNEGLLAMDFLAVFQYMLDLGSEEITLTRTPRKRLRKYQSPYLDLQVGVSNGEPSRIITLVNTGSTTIINVKNAKAIQKKCHQAGLQNYKVKKQLKISFSNSSRS